MSDDKPRLGNYEILRVLGQGAMGVVHEGIDRVNQRRVAIKTVRTTDLDPEEAEEHLRRFLIEARAAGKLDHPHIVSLYDHGEEAGTTFLVMELVVGRELQQCFDEGRRFQFTDVVRLMGELLDALGYSHRQGVVHRDVKPANIFITETGSLKLGDFGIARVESVQKTRAGLVLGTPTHMAPEQIRGERADARSDLYAAGVVLFQLLTGRRPFGGTMLSMAQKILNQPAPLPSSFDARIPPEIDTVVAKALHKSPDQRFQTAEDFAQALASAAHTLPGAVPSTARHPTMAAPSSAGVADIRAAAAAPRPSARPRPELGPSLAGGSGRRFRTPIVLAVAGGLGSALLAVYWWSGSGRPAEQTPAIGSPQPARTERPAALPQARSIPAMPPPQRPESRPEPRVAPVSPPSADGPTSPRTEPAQARSLPAMPAAPKHQERAGPEGLGQAAAPVQARAAEPAPPAARAPLPVRCSDILLKASLEPLSAEESRYLQSECQ